MIAGERPAIIKLRDPAGNYQSVGGRGFHFPSSQRKMKKVYLCGLCDSAVKRVILKV
jgi:hypothetical protein